MVLLYHDLKDLQKNVHKVQKKMEGILCIMLDMRTAGRNNVRI